MKRSKTIALVTMGVSALALNACSEAQTEALVYTTLEECMADGDLSKEACEKAYKKAETQHAEVAPKYQNKAECEADFGTEACETSPYRTSNNTSVWMPLMMGYMMGRVLAPGGVHPQPLYRSKDDPKSFRTGDNKKVAAKTGKVQVPKSTTKAPSRKLYTTARGGFGASGRTYGPSSG